MCAYACMCTHMCEHCATVCEYARMCAHVCINHLSISCQFCFLQSSEVLGDISHSDQASAHCTIDPEEDGAMASVKDPEENDEHEPDILNGHKSAHLGPASHLCMALSHREQSSEPTGQQQGNDPLSPVRPWGSK